MNRELLKEWIEELDKELFPDNPAPIKIGKTQNNVLVQFVYSIFFEYYVISDDPQRKIPDDVTELGLAVHEIRHRIQCNQLRKEFERWKNSFIVGVKKGSSKKASKMTSSLHAVGIHEIDAIASGMHADEFNNDFANHQKEIQKIIKAPIKTNLKYLKKRGLIVQRKINYSFDGISDECGYLFDGIFEKLEKILRILRP